MKRKYILTASTSKGTFRYFSHPMSFTLEKIIQKTMFRNRNDGNLL